MVAITSADTIITLERSIDVGALLPGMAIAIGGDVTPLDDHCRGCSVLIAVVGGRAAEFADALHAFAAFADEAEDLRGVVLSTEPLPTELEASLDGRVELGRLTQPLVGSPTVICADADARVRHRRALDHDGSFLTGLARAIAVFDGRIPGRRVIAAAPVLLQPAVIEPVLCEQLISASDGGGDLVLLDGALADAVVDRVQHRLVPTLRRAFGASVTDVEGLRVQTVGVGQSLGSLDTEARFDLLVTLNAGGYTGGETRFRGFSPDLHDGPAGAAMVYASGLAAEHLPVQAGARRVVRLGLR